MGRLFLYHTTNNTWSLSMFDETSHFISATPLTRTLTTLSSGCLRWIQLFSYHGHVRMMAHVTRVHAEEKVYYYMIFPEYICHSVSKWGSPVKPGSSIQCNVKHRRRFNVEVEMKRVKEQMKIYIVYYVHFHVPWEQHKKTTGEKKKHKQNQLYVKFCKIFPLSISHLGRRARIPLIWDKSITH